jgi:hypothetical protein
VNHSTKLIRDRLREVGATLQSSTARLDGTRLEFWVSPKSAYILHDLLDNGCELYAPTTKSNDLQKTVASIQADPLPLPA